MFYQFMAFIRVLIWGGLIIKGDILFLKKIVEYNLYYFKNLYKIKMDLELRTN